MKLICTFLVIALIQVSFGGVLTNPNFQPIAFKNKPQLVVPQISRISIGDRIDQQIRQTYSRYLSSSYLTYIAHIDSQRSSMFFHIYRYTIGTFLATSTYYHSNKVARINTFTRVGSGISSISEILASVDVSTFVISVDFGEGQYHAPQPSPTKFDWNETNARKNWFQDDSQTENDVHSKCLLNDAYVKKTYWYYLIKGTVTLSTSESNSPNTKSCYCVNTYNNDLGIFQVTTSWDYKTEKTIVNSFVRLGDGQNIRNCTIYPSIV